MRWFQRLGLGGIDLGIIIVMLWLVMISVAPQEGLWHIVTIDGRMIAAVTIVIYVGLAVFSQVLVISGGLAGDAWFAKLARGLITTIIVVLGFPWLIKRALFFFGLLVSANVEEILLYTAIIRFFIRWWLGRRWK